MPRGLPRNVSIALLLVMLAITIVAAIVTLGQAPPEPTAASTPVSATPTDAPENVVAAIASTPATDPQKQMLAAIDTSFSTHDLCVQMFSAILEFNAVDPVRFGLSGSNIRPASYAALDRLIELTRDCPHLIVEVIGHTDASGYEPTNQELSLRRAEAVADYMRSRGVSADRLVTMGAGSSKPLGDNATARGRRKNRRIEFSIQPSQGR